MLLYSPPSTLHPQVIYTKYHSLIDYKVFKQTKSIKKMINKQIYLYKVSPSQTHHSLYHMHSAVRVWPRPQLLREKPKQCLNETVLHSGNCFEAVAHQSQFTRSSKQIGMISIKKYGKASSKWPPVHKVQEQLAENEAEGCKTLTDYILCYSSAKSTLAFLLTSIRLEKTKHENFNFAHLLSSSFFLPTCNLKTIWCMLIQ